LHRKQLHLAAAALAVLASAFVVAPAMAASSLTGAGSTLVAPIEAEWASGFAARTGVSVSYSAVGSGTGIADITQRLVDFGASDAPLTASQASACNGCFQIPWAVSATGVGFNVAGVRRLKLSGPVLAGIYLGQITNWNDGRIAALNRGTRLPNLKITPIYRSDGSGDTYAFANFLSAVSRPWASNVGYATTVQFRAGVGAKGNSGVTSLLTSTNGGIAYIAVSYLISHQLPAAAIQNGAGRFEYPNLRNIENAAQQVKRVPASNELHIVAPGRRASIAYPISTFTYAIVPGNAPQGSLVVAFVKYALGPGQAFSQALDFASMPRLVTNAAQRTLAFIH